MDKVVLVTVTYNSSHYLRRLIEAAENQSYKIDKIVITDNASSDEHQQTLQEIEKNYENIIMLHSGENLGGGGGFKLGIKYAIKNIPEADWIWIMDDDAYPERDCLEKLIDNKGLENAGMICPMVRGDVSGEYQLPLMMKTTRYLNRNEFIHENVDEFDDVTEIEIASFVGSLVKRELIEKTGYPNSELFIEGDDTEYTYRITRNCRGYLIKGALVNHKDFPKDTDGTKSAWKIYYSYRNRMLFINQFGKSANDKNIGRALLIKNGLGEIYSIRKSNLPQKVKEQKIAYIKQGIKDGYRNRLGKVIDPAKPFHDSKSV